MRLTWKDSWATILVAAAIAAYACHLLLSDVRFIGDVRVAVAAVGLLGIGAAVVGGWHNAIDATALQVGTGLGTCATVLGVAALISANPWLLAGFVLNVLVLWGYTTLHHAGIVGAEQPDATG